MRPVILAFLAATSAAAAELPSFEATPGPIGEIRIWGSPEDAKLLADWQTGFRQYHPDASLKTELHGPDSTMAGVYAGVADLAFLSREMRQPVERMAFEWEYHHPAVQIPVANGGLTARPSAALAIFVSQDSPLTDLSMDRLRELLGSGRVYGPPVDSIEAAFIRERVLKGSYKWSAGYRTVEDVGVRLAKLAADPEGIAVAPATTGSDKVRMVSISGVLPDPANLVSHAYPLWREVAMVLNPPANPRVKEFLRYVLSAEGQAALADYLPLSAESVRSARDELAASENTIRIWGHGSYDPSIDFMGVLVKDWEQGFQKLHPEIRFENHLDGTAAAVGAVYSGAGDLALMGREIWPNEVAGFREVKGYEPTVIDVVTGSYDVRNHGYAVVFFVHKDNPLDGLTLAQLDAAFSLEHKRSGKAAKVWGDLGASGAWKDRPIHLYGLPIARGFAAYLEDAIFDGSRLWNPEIKEFADKPGVIDGGQLMLDAMASDPDAIGYAGALYHNDDVKPLALAREAGGPYIAAGTASVTDHSYPLIRMISMVLDRAPGKKADPKLEAFIRYILSRQGQEAVEKDGAGYLPMTAPFAARELKKLE